MSRAATRPKAQTDAFVVAGVVLISYLLALVFDAGEAVARFSRSHEYLQLDEFLVTAKILVPGIVFYGYRRSKEHRAQRNAAIRLASDLTAVAASRDQLVAQVSHELRTPLTGMIGLASVLEESLAGTEHAELAGLITQQGGELSHLIDDLLLRAKLDTGTARVAREAVDVDVEARNVATSIGVPVDVVASVGNTRALADPFRVRQIIRNLLTNALRYGGPTIRIEISPAADRIRLSVTDDGEGVPAGLEESIFEPYRSAATDPIEHGSIGLGLPISRDLACLMDGDLTYHRSADVTEFRLTLPGCPEVMRETDVVGSASHGV